MEKIAHTVINFSRLRLLWALGIIRMIIIYIHKSKNFQKFTFRACLQNAEKSKNNFQHLLRLRSAKFSAFFTNYRLV